MLAGRTEQVPARTMIIVVGGQFRQSPTRGLSRVPSGMTHWSGVVVAGSGRALPGSGQGPVRRTDPGQRSVGPGSTPDLSAT
jgi:hypothetical protein